MLNKVLLYFETNSFLAHGYCLTWRTDLIALHAISDLLIFASYFVIPTAIIYLFVKRPDLLPRRVAVLFSAFIFACGLTHLIGLVTLWEPIYGFEGVVKAGTAVISGATALASWMLIPTALELPSSATLSEKNAALSHSFREQRRAYEELELIKSELEQRIQERTRELQDKAEALERVNASLSQYAHFASHDLQEPLRKIVSFSEAGPGAWCATSFTMPRWTNINPTCRRFRSGARPSGRWKPSSWPSASAGASCTSTCPRSRSAPIRRCCCRSCRT